MYPDWCGSAGGSAIPQSKGSRVRFPGRAHAWVAGSVPSWGAYERPLIDVCLSHLCFSPSLPPSLPSSLKTNTVTPQSSAASVLLGFRTGHSLVALLQVPCRSGYWSRLDEKTGLRAGRSLGTRVSHSATQREKTLLHSALARCSSVWALFRSSRPK